MSYRLLVLIALVAVAAIVLLIRTMHRLSLRFQFIVLLGLGVSIGFIFLVMVQMRSFPEWLGALLFAMVFAASFFGTRIFMRSLAIEEKKTEDEAQSELPGAHQGGGMAGHDSVRHAP